MAILKNSALVGYFVPAQAVEDTEIQVAPDAALLNSLNSRNSLRKPVRDYLQAK